MKIEKLMKQYYEEQISGFCPSNEAKIRLLKKTAAAPEKAKSPLILSLVFHTALFALMGLVLWLGPGTSESLKKIDPDNVQIRRVENAINQGLRAVWASAMPRVAPPDKGE